MASESKKVVALVGAGMVAGTHVAACAASEKVQLKGLLSRRSESAKVLAVEASTAMDRQVVVYDSIEQLAADPELDFVIIATPPNVRAELVAPLAAAGKHILLEKPMGRTCEEAADLVRICNDARVTLGVVFQHRARAASMQAASLIDAGQLGQLRLVELDVPWWREQKYYDEPGRGTYTRDGGGVLISQAIHTIDLALSLTGPVSSVLAMARTTAFHTMESEDFVMAGLEFSNGAIGSLKASTASFPGGSESITLHFEHASLHLESGQLVVSYQDGNVTRFGEEAGTGGGADPMAFTHEWHQQIIENFADALNGASTLFASGEQAMASQALIDAIVRSSSSGTTQSL